MHDFFRRQDEARRKTVLFLLLFAGALLALIAALYAATLWAAHGFGDGHGWWQPALAGRVAGWTGLLIGGGMLWRLHTLRRGGPAVAQMLGARLVPASATDPARQQLLHVVEEMSIAAALPVPDVYVLPGGGINAVAAGHTADDAAIIVTQDALDFLARDELQGVVAHEFSHILNGDIRLKLLIVGVLFGFTLPGLLALSVLRQDTVLDAGLSRNARDFSVVAALIALPLLCASAPLLLAARAMKGAVMRQREHMADAAAVQFTRHPEGLARALRKIGGHPPASEVPRVCKEECGHLFVASVLPPGWLAAGPFATHPPLPARIRALDASFDGSFFIPRPMWQQEHETIHHAATPLSQHSRLDTDRITAGGITRQVGAPTAAHLALGADLRAAVPEALREAAHDPLGAVALAYALLLEDDAATRARQLGALEPHAAPAVFDETQRVQELLRPVGPELRLPLLEMSTPALRHLAPQQYAALQVNVQRLADADDAPTIFTFAFQVLLERHVSPAFRTQRRARRPLRRFRAVAADAGVVLSALARAGHAEPAARQAAFREGLRVLPDADLRYQPDVSLRTLPRALRRLARAAPPLKRRLLDACAHCALMDAAVEAEEAALLRAVAAALDCPLPPFLLPTADASLPTPAPVAP